MGVCRKRDCRAFTLLEVLLALALLVILAALTWPSLGRPLVNQRLRLAADQVRTAWARARIDAMSSGQTYVFHYVPDGDRYVIACQVNPEMLSDALWAGEMDVLSDQVDAAALAAPQEYFLPEGCRFAGGESFLDTRAELSLSLSTPLLDEELAWAEPIFFYPDGTTSTARLGLINENGRLIELFLRGLTGVVTLSPIQAVEQ